MKKYYFFLFLIISNLTNGQNAFYDAIKLKAFIQGSGKFDTSTLAVKEYAAILKTYTTTNADDGATVVNMYRNNPFIKDFVPTYRGAAGGNPIEMNKILTAFSKKAGGIDVTNFADGMAKFLVERAKQELNTAYFEKFQTTLKSNEELQLLFPKTYDLLRVVGKDVYNIQLYLNSLREAFEYDLSSIIRNGRIFVETSSKLEGLRKDKKTYAAILASFDLAEALQAGEHPSEAIASLASKEYLSDLDSNLYKAIRTFTVFSNSLRSFEGDRYWVSREEFKQLENPTVFRIYLGLIYQKFPKEISFSAALGGRSSLNFDSLVSFARKPGNYFLTIKRMEEAFQKIESSAYTIKQKGKESTGMDYYAFYGSVLSLVDVAYKEFNEKKEQPVKEYQDFKFYANLTGEIYLNTYQRKYSMAIMNTVVMIDSLLKDKELSSCVLKYGSFMATVVKAENSDQVKQAIESVALPPGSSRIKRESLWNISINAYLGGYSGAEYIQKLRQNNLKASVGLSAPVGIAFSRGSKFLRKDKSKGGWSYSVFLSFIDVGAIASFRLKDSTTAALPQLKLENILAPGAYLITGIPKSPLSMGLFLQYGPSLRTVSPQNVSVSSYNETTWRFGGMIAVDLPLLNLYNKGR